MKSNTFYRRVKEYEYIKKQALLKEKLAFSYSPFEGMGKNTHDTFGLSSMGLKNGV